MAAESNRRYHDLHAAFVSCPYRETLMDHLHTVSPRVMEVAMYCIHLGATSTMATAQLRLREDLIVVEPGFLGEMSHQQRENLIGEFFAMGDGILAAVDIIRNTLRE
jgi:hypothetical protein